MYVYIVLIWIFNITPWYFYSMPVDSSWKGDKIFYLCAIGCHIIISIKQRQIFEIIEEAYPFFIHNQYQMVKDKTAAAVSG